LEDTGTSFSATLVRIGFSFVLTKKIVSFGEYLPPHPVGKLVVLRFERFVIAGSELFSDPLYLPEIEISFSANCKIPPQYLEACVHPTHDKCPEWAPIVL